MRYKLFFLPSGWFGLFLNGDFRRREPGSVRTAVGHLRRRLSAILAVFMGAAASAGANTWTGAVDGDWNNPGNWSDGIVPPATLAGLIALAAVGRSR